MMQPIDAAWDLLKALPEQQQYTDLSALNEGFEQPTPQHRVGTVHPAIRQMLQRLQGRRAQEGGMDVWDKPSPAAEPDLRTTGTAPQGGNPEVPNMIAAHSGRMGMPSRSHELYDTGYGQSPQYVADIPGVYREGDAGANSEYTWRAQPVHGSLESNVVDTRTPPKDSQQALIDYLYSQDPDSAAAMLG